VSYSTTIHVQAANLYAQAQGGDAQSLEELMRMHEGLVHHIVRQQWRGQLSYEQAIHVGHIGLWRAVHCADREQEATLFPVSNPSSVDPRAEVWAGEVQSALYALVARLPALQGWIVCVYYGLDNQGGCTLAELGRRRGCSRQAIHYHLHKALIALRHPAFSALLRALLDRNSRAAYLGALRAQGRQR